MEKREIIKIIENCAIKYKNNLSNKNLLFIYYDNNKLQYIEAKFLPSNFLHLTGVKYERKSNNNAIKFYKDILDKKILLERLKIANEGILKLKLNILNMILDINYSAKMIGEFNSNCKNLLVTEKIVGTNIYSMGFIKVGKYYIPNTTLKENIRNITDKTSKVVAIFSKEIKEEQYINLTYLNKKIELSQIFKNKEILTKINIENLYSKNKKFDEKKERYKKNNNI